ncbi:MAG: glycoside hydrolase family 3 N-terminal domain-containing protein, partial [Bacteroidales bacterium]
MKKSPLLLCLLFTGLASGLLAQLPYTNPALSHEARAQDLLNRLTLEEKVALMQDQSAAVPRLGVPEFGWWNEALHGVARNGYATVFPQAIGMAATFDEDAVFRTFTAVSDEARAKATHSKQVEGRRGKYRNLTFWTPNINIFRDPRWGRGQETYGEDPYLTTRLGVAVVKGLQGPDDSHYAKAMACAKHYAVHSGPEWNRHSFDAKNIQPEDLWETYLPAFRALVQEANVKQVMCAYNRYEGDPCCGSDRLLVNILREGWDYQHLVVSDCGAIDDFYKKGRHETHPDSASASSAAVRSGTDLECGRSYKSLIEAVKKGLIEESELDVSLKRLLKARFELGDFDPDSLVSWTRIPMSVVNCEAHQQLALEMARKSLVLLKNDKNALPLPKKTDGILVMGPNADNESMQWGNYNGTP